MERIKKLVVLVLLLMLVAGFLSVAIKSRQYGMSVPKGFAFGAPNNQVRMNVEGMYAVTNYGYPATYKITETFRPTGDVFNTVSYDSMRFNPAAVIANIIFWTSLFVTLLAPVTIFYRPKKKSNEVKVTEGKNESQAKQTHANTRD